MRVSSSFFTTVAVFLCTLPAFANSLAYVRLGTSTSLDITSGVTYTNYTDFTNNNGSNITPFTAAYTNTNNFFADHNYVYRTNSIGSYTASVTRYTSIANMATNTGGVESALSQFYDVRDEFFSDGTYYYKTDASSGYQTSITRYASYTALLNNTAGQTFDFETVGYDYYATDEIFSDGTYYYRINANYPSQSGNNAGVSKYQTFNDLLNDSGMSFNYFPVGEERAALEYFAVPIPEPATALLLAGGAVLFGLKRRK